MADYGINYTLAQVGATSRSRPGGRSYRREYLQSAITVAFLNETIFIRIGIT